MKIRLLSAVLVAIAAGGMGTVASAPAIPAAHTVLSQDVFGGCTVPHAAHLFRGTQVGPSVGSAGPRRLVVAWQQDRWGPSGAEGIVGATSTDAGSSWQPFVFPISACAPNGLSYTQASDPWVSVASDGNAYVSGLALSPVKLGANSWSIASSAAVVGRLAITSRDSTWKSVTVVATGDVGKPTVTADPSNPQVAYLVYQQGFDAYMSITVNGGSSWSAPKVIVHPVQKLATAVDNQILVDPRHHRLVDVFDLVTLACPHNGSSCLNKRYKQGLPSFNYTIAAVRSSNGGATWTRPVTVAPDRWSSGSGCTGHLAAGKELPSAAISPSTGRLYVAWEQGPVSVSGGCDWIELSTSQGGAHWSKPQRVSSRQEGLAFDPAVAVDGRGDVGISYASVPQPAKSGAGRAAEWFVSSHASPLKFSQPNRLAGPFALAHAPGLVLSGNFFPFLGNYQGLSGTPSGFVAAYATGTKNGTLIRVSRLTGS